ncbi:hypothetical protein LIA77_07641 [Sarocladium implicatum]|nr:hypothetical protein LIA77_07641 [Sarocladium implicatum]
MSRSDVAEALRACRSSPWPGSEDTLPWRDAAESDSSASSCVCPAPFSSWATFTSPSLPVDFSRYLLSEEVRANDLADCGRGSPSILFRSTFDSLLLPDDLVNAGHVDGSLGEVPSIWGPTKSYDASLTLSVARAYSKLVSVAPSSAIPQSAKVRSRSLPSSRSLCKCKGKRGFPLRAPDRGLGGQNAACSLTITGGDGPECMHVETFPSRRQVDEDILTSNGTNVSSRHGT